MRETLFDAYKAYSNKYSFDEFLFRNHIFYLLPDSYSAKVKSMFFFTRKKKRLQEKYIELLAEFADLTKIKIIFLKGLVLANNLYRDPDLRLSGDIDIYIEEKDYKIIEGLLISYSFSVEKDETGFHIGFFKIEDNSEIVIEVHQKLYVSSAEAFSLIKSVPVRCINTRVVSYRCKKVNVLDYSYEFLYLFMHSLRHFVDGTVHPIFFILSNYPVARIIELVLYVHKYQKFIDWKFIRDYLNKLKIGTLINNFLRLISIFIPEFNFEVNSYDSRNVFKNEVLFELYKEISEFNSFDYIFLNSNQIWTKAVLINNTKNKNGINLKQKYGLKIQKAEVFQADVGRYSVTVDLLNNKMFFSFYYPKEETFMERKDFLWMSDSIELILFVLDQQEGSFYHRFFSFRNNDYIETYEDDYRQYRDGNFYNEIKVTEGIIGSVKSLEKENCILLELDLDKFDLKVQNLFFDFVINLNIGNELLKLSLSESDPNKYLLPFNYSKLC